MDLNEVKQFIETNKEQAEVKEYLQGLNKISVEGIEKFVAEDESAKKWLDSTKDKHFNKALETWKSNNLENLIDDEVKKRFPAKDEKEIQVEKLRNEIEKMKQEKLHETLISKAVKLASEKNLPVDLVDFFIADNEENTAKNISVFEENFNSSVQKAVETRLKGEGYTHPNSTMENMKPKNLNEALKNYYSNKN
ncbi:DUF4355 domain-containing protein [Clostridium sp. WILCCON 0269]|uniref:DUF4355 domain-containing protein n=1 Tax=Candidatus Clostridium eludens TaxID=3381663 RepID=A0ABW8SHY2_9CLOT